MNKFQLFQEEQDNNSSLSHSLTHNNAQDQSLKQACFFDYMDDENSKYARFQKLNNFHFNQKDNEMGLFSKQGFIEEQSNYSGVDKTKNVSKFNKNSEQKLKKNRQSAKMFRQKKKQYINVLEQKNLRSQQKILFLQTKLKQVQLQRDRLRNGDNIYIKSFKQMQKQNLDKIQKCLQNHQNNPKKLRDSLDQYNQNFGSTGTQRIDLLNYHMSEIIQNLMNDFQKYFINCFLYDRGIFGPNNRQVEIDLQTVSQNPEGHMQRMQKKYGQRLQKHLSEFSQMIQVFYKTNIKLRTKCHDIQSLLRQMGGEYQDKRLAQIILWFQNNKHREEMNLKGEWYNAFKGDQKEIIEDLVKLNKVY